MYAGEFIATLLPQLLSVGIIGVPHHIWFMFSFY